MTLRRSRTFPTREERDQAAVRAAARASERQARLTRGMGARPHGLGMDEDIEGAVLAYMGGVAERQWRSRSDLRAAAEAMLGYRVEVDEVTRVLRAYVTSGQMEDRTVQLSDLDSDLYRREYRLL